MKLIIVTLFAITFIAQTTSAFPFNTIDDCESTADLANAVMEVRQSGEMTAIETINLLRESFQELPDEYRAQMAEVAFDMVTEAYEYPAMRTMDARQDAVSQFENRWTLRCLRAIR